MTKISKSFRRINDYLAFHRRKEGHHKLRNINEL